MTDVDHPHGHDRRLPIDEDVIRRVAEAPPIPVDSMPRLIEVWGSALAVYARRSRYPKP